MITCTEDDVSFPHRREDQTADLMSLAGDALMRGDRIAWAALYRASKELEGMPEFDSPEGKAMSADLAAMIGKAGRPN